MSNPYRNVGPVPDSAVLVEHGALIGHTEIDVRDEYLVNKAQYDQGTLSGIRDDGRKPACATLIANGVLAVSPTSAATGCPPSCWRKLHGYRMLVVVEDSTDRRLFSGTIETS